MVYNHLSEDKELFDRAKSKEVKSFLAQEAVRKCLSKAEEDEARQSGRVLGCRWVLTWKTIPPEEQEEAQKSVKSDPSSTTITRDAAKKAKARIVLLGFQHPDLLNESLRSPH